MSRTLTLRQRAWKIRLIQQTRMWDQLTPEDRQAYEQELERTLNEASRLEQEAGKWDQ